MEGFLFQFTKITELVYSEFINPYMQGRDSYDRSDYEPRKSEAQH